MPGAACTRVSIDCSEWMCELRYLLFSFSCTYYMAWGAGFWGGGVEAGSSFAGNWYNLLFFPVPFQIHFVPLPCERDYHRQWYIAKLKLKLAGIFLIVINCGKLGSFKIGHASSRGTWKRDWLDRSRKEESRLGSSRAYSALICFSRTSSDLFFPTFFLGWPIPLASS